MSNNAAKPTQDEVPVNEEEEDYEDDEEEEDDDGEEYEGRPGLSALIQVGPDRNSSRLLYHDNAVLRPCAELEPPSPSFPCR